jgi:hypothetical protein
MRCAPILPTRSHTHKRFDVGFPNWIDCVAHLARRSGVKPFEGRSFRSARNGLAAGVRQGETRSGRAILHHLQRKSFWPYSNTAGNPLLDGVTKLRRHNGSV